MEKEICEDASYTECSECYANQIINGNDYREPRCPIFTKIVDNIEQIINEYTEL